MSAFLQRRKGLVERSEPRVSTGTPDTQRFTRFAAQDCSTDTALFNGLGSEHMALPYKPCGRQATGPALPSAYQSRRGIMLLPKWY